jgi:TPR repeat protein
MMSASRTNRDLPKLIDALRLRVAQGDVLAMCDLGMWLQEGFQDKSGRSVVRRNPAYAFRLLKGAAERGHGKAASSLGYAYDVGLGTKPNKRQAVRWYGQDVRNGGTTGAANLATIYRDAGDLRRAFRWWMRAATMGDGDAMGDAGYCLQYGIGTRRNITLARRLLRSAIAGRDISMWGREEAMYQLALTYLDAGKQRLAVPLLTRAAADGDYREADAALKRIRLKRPIEPCRCRRFINKDLRGHAECSVHPRLGR